MQPCSLYISQLIFSILHATYRIAHVHLTLVSQYVLSIRMISVAWFGRYFDIRPFESVGFTGGVPPPGRRGGELHTWRVLHGNSHGDHGGGGRRWEGVSHQGISSGQSALHILQELLSLQWPHPNLSHCKL